MREMRLHRWRSFGAALLIGAFAAGLWASCAAETQAQMACCAGADHDCGPSMDNASCCVTDAQSRDSSATLALAPALRPPSPAVLPAAVVLPVDHVARAWLACEAFGRQILRIPEQPRYLLASTFLI